MPTRKQRRRRDKTFRHEYDLVVYDGEGNEVPVDPAELRAARDKGAAKGKKGKQRGGRAPRAPRVVAPPTWERALKRGGLMGGVLLIAMILLKGPLILGVVYGVALIPFTYLDRPHRVPQLPPSHRQVIDSGAPMPLAIDHFVMSAYQSNCYVVRADPAPPKPR